MDYQKRYREWLENDYFDIDTKAELTAIKENDNEIKERFYKELEFGTAGLRGVIGAGTNRMNIYTVRKATQGLANYILKNGAEGRGLHTIPDECHRNLRTSRRFALQQMGSRHMYLNHSARHRNFLLQ